MSRSMFIEPPLDPLELLKTILILVAAATIYFLLVGWIRGW